VLRGSLTQHRKIWLAFAVVVLLALLLVRSNSAVLVGAYPAMDSYHVVDERTIEVTVAVAPRSWTRVTGVAETPTEVRVTVESLDWPIPLPGAGYLELRTLTLSLANAVEARVVRDAAGTAIPAR
jgi:uncharacterized protein (DUF58 family)